jgi:hypothetical protein
LWATSCRTARSAAAMISTGALALATGALRSHRPSIHRLKNSSKRFRLGAAATFRTSGGHARARMPEAPRQRQAQPVGHPTDRASTASAHKAAKPASSTKGRPRSRRNRGDCAACKVRSGRSSGNKARKHKQFVRRGRQFQRDRLLQLLEGIGRRFSVGMEPARRSAPHARLGSAAQEDAPAPAAAAAHQSAGNRPASSARRP